MMSRWLWRRHQVNHGYVITCMGNGFGIKCMHKDYKSNAFDLEKTKVTDRFKKYGGILKKSIEYAELGSDRIFFMKDMFSVERALEQGAEKYTDEIDVERLNL